MSSKCPICTKTVYQNEATKYSGASYHRACFKCNEAGCGISLDQSTASAFADQVYCKKHISKYAATGSVRGGSNAFGTQYGGAASQGLDADLAAKAAAKLDLGVLAQAAEYINSAVAGANVGTDAKSFAASLQDGGVLKKLVGLKSKAGKVSAFDARSQITEFLNAAKAEGANRASFTVVDLYESKNIASVVDTIMDLKRARGGSTAAKTVTVSSGGGDMCAVCNKKVYANEMQKAIGKVFHQTCFKCSQCSASLSSATLLEDKGKPYCQRCHKKLAAPKAGNREQKTGGLDADLKAKKDANFNVAAMADAANYVNSKTGSTLSTTDKQAFADGLRDGMVLAKLANTWDAGFKVPSKPNKMSFGQRAQIGEFLALLGKRNVPTTFMTVDLFEDKDIGQVVLTLLTCQKMLK